MIVLDLNKCGLELLCAFQQTEGVRRLNGPSFSGGEKSVATMLFLISLQNLLTVPIRIIDEINQGMDHRNERYVFEVCRWGALGV